MNFFLGKATKAQHAIWMGFAIAIYCVLMAASASFYTGGTYIGLEYKPEYSMHNSAISNLGNPNLNLGGWWIFTVAMIWMGIFLGPHFWYLFRALRPAFPRFSKLIGFFGVCCTTGLVGVAIFNENIIFWHYCFAVLVFGGAGLSMLFLFVAFLRKWYEHAPWPSPGVTAGLYIPVLLACCVLISEIIRYGTDDPRELNFAEWVSFITISLWLIGLFFITPAPEKKIL